MPNSDERTEQATPQKRQKAREKGQLPRSRELASTFVSLSIFLTLSMFGGKLVFDIKKIMIDVFKNLENKDYVLFLNNTFFEMAFMLFPVLLISMCVGIMFSIVQGGFVIKPLEVEWEKLNPLNGLQKIFSSQNIVELLKSFFKFLVGGFIFYMISKKIILESVILPKTDFQAIINITYFYISKSTKYILFAFIALAAGDYALQYWLFEKSIRMSKQEIREEYKEQEGDPLVKSRVKSLQKELAQRRMMQDVAKATVVVTNPTHIAVALKYSKEIQAPKVVGKGVEFLAEKIKAIAKKNNIPIVEDKPLARALYRLEIGDYIPKELYRAVAKIIAFIYKKQNKNF